MPAYGTFANIPSLSVFHPMHTALVLNNEAVVVNEFTERVCLAPGPVGGQKGVRIVIDFNQNPGNVEFDVVEANNDAAGTADFVIVPTGGQLTQAALTNGPNGPSTRLVTDLIPIAGDLVAGFVKTAPSNGGTKATMRITRAA